MEETVILVLTFLLTELRRAILFIWYPKWYIVHTHFYNNFFASSRIMVIVNAKFFNHATQVHNGVLNKRSKDLTRPTYNPRPC